MKANNAAPNNSTNNNTNNNVSNNTVNSDNNENHSKVHQRQTLPQNRNINHDIEAGNALPPYSVRNEKIYQQEIEYHEQIRHN